jgi:hypothetical protein
VCGWGYPEVVVKAELGASDQQVYDTLTAWVVGVEYLQYFV